ncbi:MAG: type II toxin-antitoxin system HipA family toxin [Burkholderiales bacterium]|nr:type II toxin-antitoxin system HipA family toxin [Burkholderiales bacterium]
MLPERIKALHVSIAAGPGGELVHQSQYEFRYAPDVDKDVGLLMPARMLSYRDTPLFPVMDQHLPEGDLFVRLRHMFPKQALTPMHLLALVGENGIGRLGYRVPGQMPAHAPVGLSRQALLEMRYSPQVFDDLVAAYLSTGVGVAGMQPKIMVPDRPTIPIPNVIVKAASPAYPHLAANEYLCMQAAHQAGIATAACELTYDGQMLLVDRFDVGPQGQRLGFEDIAALMGLSVRDTLADRKYQGSYQRVVEVLRAIRLPAAGLRAFYEQLVLSVMVRNGDAHLKNFGVLYDDAASVRMAPMFDVVTTTIYRYTRFAGGPEYTDNTMALKLFAGKGGSKGYPLPKELLRFGKEVCSVHNPAEVVHRVAQGMAQVLAAAGTDARIPAVLLAQLQPQWQIGMDYAREVRGAT